METSLIADDVELIATTVQDQLSEVWENVENHRDLILEKIQEVKTVLEQLRIRAEQSSEDKPTKTKEGVPIRETVKITVQRSTNFIITHVVHRRGGSIEALKGNQDIGLGIGQDSDEGAI
jgi:hypothetical protein